MNQQLAPSTICLMAAVLLFLLGIGESWLGARRRNLLRQRGGYGMVTLGLIFLLGAIVLAAFRVR